MSDPRHLHRQKLLQKLFTCTFSEHTAEQRTLEDDQVPSTVIEELLEQLDEIDAQITSAAPERPIAEMNRMNVCILRLILFEARTTKTPPKVLVDEANELAKEFSDDSAPGFINGVLAKLLLDHPEDSK